jgi:hypothetical protein
VPPKREREKKKKKEAEGRNSKEHKLMKLEIEK